MRLSKLFSHTLREAPSEAEVASHQLLLRAGFIRQLGAGLFSYLPLARRSLSKIESIMRHEINAIGGQELTLPLVNAAEVWRETGSWYPVGAEVAHFTDRAGRDLVLASTHEEVVADLARKEIRSHRQLPQLVYQIQTKWRDDLRPRAGLMRAREFTMLDSYSLDADLEGLDGQYRAHYQAYFNIFNRCGLPVIAVKSDAGMMGGLMAHEFICQTPIGEETLLLCEACGYAANRQVATFRKPALGANEPRPLEKVATPEAKSIEALSAFLGVPAAQTAKAVFMVATVVEGKAPAPQEKFIFAVMRGDMELNEAKLANAVHAHALRPAREEEIRAVGAVPGYASPIGLQGIWVVVDEAIPLSPNLVAGANEEGYHLLNTNYGRDYIAQSVCDLAAAGDGAACVVCGAPLRSARGVKVGNISKLGTRYTATLGATFHTPEGVERPVVLGSYGIDSGRLLACIAEISHDDYGLIWPVSVAPYEVHLVAAGASAQTLEAARGLYAALQAAGVEALYDDRDERPGVKFMDADLIGVPLRVTLGDKSLKQGGVDLKRRPAPEKVMVPLEQAVERVKAEIAALERELAQRGVTLPFLERTGELY
jgi:prolyl-tRNA synthetase